MKKLFVLLVAMLMVQGCAKKPHELKSPCVGASGSPCEKRPVNDWWLRA